MPADLRARLTALESRLGVGQRRPPLPPEPPPGAPVAPPTLAARLQRLAAIDRVREAKRPVSPEELARSLRGDVCAEGVIMVEQTIPLTQIHGRIPLREIASTPLDFLAGGAAPALESLLFIDTETSGLAGGTGTVAFVLGLARIREGRVIVRQYLLTAFGGEPAMLTHALEWIGACSHLVSFNGKTFDVPLLTTRYLMSRLASPLHRLPHIDLLHRTRAAFRRNWPDCKLQTAERELLRFHRQDDTGGHLIPEIWTALVQRGETAGLKGVVHHNRLDVLSLVALLAVLGRAYAEPGHVRADPLGLARAHRQAGDTQAALRHLQDSGEALSADARLELATLLAREGDWPGALPVLEDLAGARDFRAMEKLAKYHEHEAKDYAAALRWTEQLIEAGQAVDQARRRQDRLRRKLEGGAARPQRVPRPCRQPR